MITSDRIIRLLTCADQGVDPGPLTVEEWREYDAILSEVSAIKVQGLAVDIPFEIEVG